MEASLLHADQALAPCRPGTPALSATDCDALLATLPAWQRVEVAGIFQLQRSYRFPDFAAALAFANRVGALAEAADHHPTITLEWGKVTLHWWTHVIGGLHGNDFIMAERCDRASDPQQSAGTPA